MSAAVPKSSEPVTPTRICGIKNQLIDSEEYTLKFNPKPKLILPDNEPFSVSATVIGASNTMPICFVSNQCEYVSGKL